jgi:hypothetical protein
MQRVEPEAALVEALAAIRRRDFARAEALLASDAAPLARLPGPVQRSFYMARARLALLHDLFEEGDALAGAAERQVLRREADPDAWVALAEAGDPDARTRAVALAHGMRGPFFEYPEPPR